MTEVAARKAVLRRQRRCFLCLQTSHIVRNCTSKYRCKKCKGKHNISICESKTPPAWNNGSEAEGKTLKVTGNIMSTEKSTTFLQSAKAILMDKAKKKRIVRVLFDNGSQKSFVTQAARNALNLPTIRKDRMIIM